MTGDSESANDKQVEDRLLALYVQSSEVVTHFWEWRHKVILLAASNIALVFAITSWMYKEGLGGVTMAFPLVVGGCLFLVFALFDRRNGMIIQACYQSARTLEQAMRAERVQLPLPEGVFHGVQASRTKDAKYQPLPWTYGWVLRALYCGMGGLLIWFGGVSLTVGLVAPHRLIPGQT